MTACQCIPECVLFKKERIWCWELPWQPTHVCRIVFLLKAEKLVPGAPMTACQRVPRCLLIKRRESGAGPMDSASFSCSKEENSRLGPWFTHFLMKRAFLSVQFLCDFLSEIFHITVNFGLKEVPSAK